MITMFAVLIMVDFMFFDASSFIYEPDVKVRRFFAQYCRAAHPRCAVSRSLLT